MLHGESLATKELCPELREMMDAVIRNMKYVKIRPLKSRLLQNYAGKSGHGASRSRFTVIVVGRQEEISCIRVCNLRAGVALFSENENRSTC
jgi:hypothetical protein